MDDGTGFVPGTCAVNCSNDSEIYSFHSGRQQRRLGRRIGQFHPRHAQPPGSSPPCSAGPAARSILFDYNQSN